MNTVTNASFSIKDYVYDKINIDLFNKGNDQLSLNFEPSGIFDEEESTYELTFKIDIKSDDKTMPFISIQCKGLFKFTNAITFGEIPDYFYNNSIAILFPYLRSYVSLVTTQANIPGIILPTLNLMSLGEDLKAKSAQKKD